MRKARLLRKEKKDALLNVIEDQIKEAQAILGAGTRYERLHVAGILDMALSALQEIRGLSNGL
jgi:hypothetical protein